MSKTWFLDLLGKGVAPGRVRRICEDMELSEMETSLILDRFCRKPRKGQEQCGDYYPVDQQKYDMPSLDSRVRGWCDANTGYFEPIEIVKIYGPIFSKRQAVE